MVDLPVGLGAIYDVAAGGTIGGWVNIGVNLIVSTIVMGLVLMVLLEIISKAWGEPVKVSNSFIAAFVINLINLPIITGLLGGIVSMVPFGLLLFPLIVWIVVIKLFFGRMSLLHTLILGVIGFLLSIYLIPAIIGMVMGYLSF